MQFRLDTWRNYATPDKPIEVEFVPVDDNLFVYVNGINSNASLWFHRDDDSQLVITFGTTDGDGDWEPVAEIVAAEE